MLKLANSALKPPDSLVGAGELGLQLLEYGAGMFGQVRQLSQGPSQSRVTDGDQVLEKQALLVRDRMPAEQLGFHYSFGKRHVGADRGINPTTTTAKKWLKSEQKAVLSPRSPLRFLRIQLLLLPLPTPPILAFVTEDCGAPGCGAGSSAVPNAAAVCSSAPSSKLEVVFKKRRRGNPGADRQETGSGLSATLDNKTG